MCLYDEECPGYAVCIKNECVVPFLPGTTCKLVPTPSTMLVGALREGPSPTIDGEEPSSCEGYGLVCDPFSRTCQFGTRELPAESEAAICSMDADCPAGHHCDLLAGTCMPLPTLGQECSRPCQSPYVCHEGTCHMPCLSDYDCYVGSMKGDATGYTCNTTAGVCMVAAKGKRVTPAEMAIAFGLQGPGAAMPPPKPTSPAPSVVGGQAGAKATSSTIVPPLPMPAEDAQKGEALEAGSQGSSVGPPLSDHGLPSMSNTSPQPLPDIAHGDVVEGNVVHEAGVLDALGDAKWPVLVGSVLGGALILFLIIFFCIRRRRAKRAKASKLPSMANSSAPPMDYKDPVGFMKSAQPKFDEPPPMYKYY